MGKINWHELFPTKFSLLIFISYICLFINQGLLVTASQGTNNKYEYNIVTVVLMTEVFKLLVSVVLFCKDNSFIVLIRDIIKNYRVLLLYLVPAVLYCIYNNLAFVNLSAFDPTTYYLLLQFRVVITGIVFQVVFKKYLSKKQWISLVILTVGCMLKEFDLGSITTDSSNISNKNTRGLDLSVNAVLIFVQTFCSCFAGVYNEYLLKNVGADVNIYTQNVFMYLDSIVCNSVILLFQGNLVNAFTPDNLASIFHFKVLVVMLNNAAVGIITSFFLKSLNSILKSFASALELIFTAILSYVLFGIPIYLNTVLAISVVSYAIILYTQNPVSNVKPPSNKNEDKEELMMATV